MLRVTLLLVLLSLAVAATASAGGWATAGIAPLPPDRVDAGDTWTTTITVLQHGRTPLDGVEPTLTIRNGDDARTFAAKPTGEPGRYAVDVTFPSSGAWTIAVYDGFDAYGGARTTTFGTVEVAGTAATSGGTSLAWPLGGAVAALGAAGALLFLRRRAGRATPLRTA